MNSDPEIGTILICALRYCVGRQTYMPGLVIDWAKRHWDAIHSNDQNLIKKEVEEIFEKDHYLGDRCDIETWENFRDWLSSGDD